MNKYKKIAMAVVATVMAGTMALSMTACGDPNPNPGPGPGPGPSDSTDKYGVLNADGSLNYEAYDRGGAGQTTELAIAIGHQNKQTSTHFSPTVGANITLPDGKTYTNSNAKPAWVAMGKDLNISWKEVYQGSSTGGNLGALIAPGGGYDTTDMFTTDLSVAVEKAADGTASILNLADYLDYMPNFAKFLNENPIVYLSLLQYGMQADGTNKILYVAPYFDGNDDIERYCIIRQDWAEKLLNGNTASTSTATFADECGNDVSVEAFMGSTNYSIESLNATGTGKQTITKNYTAVVTALKDVETNALKTAYNAIDSNGYSGTSGNIVDVMNAALTANKNATGAQLLELFRAYIDVCYGSVYTPATRANLFNGYDAAWDVDDLVAMLRVVKTNASEIASNSRTIQGIAPRRNDIDRTPDMVRLACQLYGVRGADSRYENTYIDGNGTLQDARLDKEFYEALERFHTLRNENLVIDFTTTSGKNDSGITGSAETFFMYDYSQTQTKQNFYVEEDDLSGDTLNTPDGYNFAPIMTPVSRWDTDGNAANGHETTMRFTESWRSTKTGGLALNGNLVNKPAKLKAALQFVDYLYSEDGQIVSTFGPKADNASGTNGFWYNEVQSNPVENTYDNDGNIVTAKNYFTFKGVKYSGYEYKGNITPTITQALYDSFTFKNVCGYNISSLPQDEKVNLSFTDYARKLIGSTLPVGVKNQAFEDQLTSANGRAGAKKVGVALSEQFQTVKGMTLKVDVDNLWYTCVPTGLPIIANHVTQLSASTQDKLRYVTGLAEKDSKGSNIKTFHTIFNYIILNGATGEYSRGNAAGHTYTFATTNPLDTLVADMAKSAGEGGFAATVRENYANEGWQNAKTYWTYVKPNN